MIQFYLTTQFSIFVGYVCAAILYHLWKRSNSRSSCKQLKILNQVLFGIALFLPLVVTKFNVSRSVLPDVVRQPLAESAQILNQPIKTPFSFSRISQENALKKEILSLPTFSLSDTIYILAIVGFILGTLRLFRNLISLNTLLMKSHVFKKCGSLKISISDATAVPFSLWYFGARWIVFPQHILEDAAKFKMSLKHELEHQRSQDTVWAFLLEFFAPFFFINPAFFLWKKTILELQEFSCDESLIGRKKMHPRKYGDCLLSVAEAALRSRLRLSGVAAMANHSQSQTILERRVRMLTSYKKNRPTSILLTFTSFILIFTMTGLCLSLNSLAAISNNDPTPGIATVDPRVQKITEKYLIEAFQKFRATAGFALVSEASTGRVLAVANINSEPSAPHSPHWSLSLRVEPASVMKALIAAAAIEKGATEPSEVHDCENGKLLVGDKEFGDWKAFDKLTTAQTVAQSSNVCGIKIGRKLGAEKIQEALKTFGLTDPAITAHFPEARAGLLPQIEELGKEQYVARVPSGFGIYTTPLEILQVFGAIANGGNLYAPIQANEKSHTPLRRILSEKTAKEMRSILGLVMTEGTAKESQGKKFILAGKTGTAYSPWLVGKDVASKDSQIAHFVGFGPLEAPKYVVYVGVQDPKNNEDHRAHGASHAAPVFREIIETLLADKI